MSDPLGQAMEELFGEHLVTCPACHGMYSWRNPCDTCLNTGKVLAETAEAHAKVEMYRQSILRGPSK